MNPTKIQVWTCKWRIGSCSGFLVVMSTIICLKTIFSSSLLSFVSYGVRVLCYLYLFIYIVTRCSCFSTITTSAISRNCLHFWGTWIHPQFSVGMCYSIFRFLCSVLWIIDCPFPFGHCIVCSSVFWPLYCLSFDLRLHLITPLVSSNFWPLYCLSYAIILSFCININVQYDIVPRNTKLSSSMLLSVFH